MENSRKRIYPAQQLVCALPPTVLKCYMWLLGWQSQETIKIFVKQIAKATKLNETEVELAIQTLEDVHLIDISKIDQTYCAALNAEQAQKYFQIPMNKIMESDGVKVSDTVRWNKDEGTSKSNDIEDMSDEELKLLLRRISISLSEREQLKKKIINNEPTDLPW